MQTEKPTTENILSFQKKVFENPVWFCEEVLKDKKPWAKEAEILEALRDNKEVIVRSCNASGKFVRSSEPVLTATGWKPIGELKVGEQIYTQDGTLTSVTAVHKQGKQQLYRFHLENGIVVDSGLPHLWTVDAYTHEYGDNCKRKKRRLTLTTEKIIKRYQGLNNKPDPSYKVALPMVQPIEFPAQPIPLDPYVLGLLLGDGGILQKSTTFTTADTAIIKHIQDAGISVSKYKNKYGYGVLNISSILDDLKIRFCKSNAKFVPKIYLWNKPSIRLAVLQGLMDTDGSIHTGMEYTTTSYQLAQDVLFLIQSLGGRASLRSRTTYFTYKGIKKAGQLSYRLGITMPICPFRLKRKANIWNKLSVTRHKTTAYTIQKITKVDEDDCTCITVSHQSGLFVLKNFIVTHNSFSAARAVHWWLVSHKDAVVITTAPTNRQVREVLWREIRDAVAGKKIYPENSVTETKINLDNKWFALGLSTDKPDQFAGFHSDNLLVVIDEASGIDTAIYEAIDGLKPKKTLLLGNPLRNTGRFAELFKSGNLKKIHISAFDTPNLVASGYDTFEKFRTDYEEHGSDYFVHKNIVLINGLTTLNDVVKFAERYGVDSDVFKVRVLGEFPSIDSDTFIDLGMVLSAMDREVEVLKFEKKLGVDVARYGGDRSAFIVRHDNKVIRKEVMTGQNLMNIAGMVMNIAKEEDIRAENIFIDVIGYGAGVVDRLREQGWLVQGVNVASSPINKEQFANTRAELFFKLRDWLKVGNIPKDDDFLELTSIKYYFNSKGQLQLEAKEDIKNRGLKSPDIGDALALTFAITDNLGNFVMPRSVGGVHWDYY